MSLNKAVIVIGAGGHASVLVDMLKQQGCSIAAIVSPEISNRRIFDGIQKITNDEEVLKFDRDVFELVNGLGSLPGNKARIKIYNYFKQKGYIFRAVISSAALISSGASLGEGVQVMPGVIIQTGTIIGDNTIINTGAIIEHDSCIGNHAHIAPNALVCGDVKIGSEVHIGAGAVVIQSLTLGRNSVVGAGACLTVNLEEDNVAYPPKVKIIKRK